MFQLLRQLSEPTQCRTMLDIQMDSNPVLNPNDVLAVEDVNAVTLHVPDCGLFSNNCNTAGAGENCILHKSEKKW